MARLIWAMVLLAACSGDAPSGNAGENVGGVDGADGVDGRPADYDRGDLGNTLSIDAGISDLSTGCGPCNQPPTACHAPAGSCVGGHCVYDVVEGLACDDGNACTVGDICTAGVCAGKAKVCNQPPVAACVSGTDLLTYDAVGSCHSGACVYAQHDVACGTGGCVANACSTDPCTGLTCHAPPSTCFKAAGVCSVGSCSYAYDDGVACNDSDPCTDADQCNTGVCKGKPKSCLAPPADHCDDTTTLRSYDPVGSCGAGACSYTYHFVTCAAGCANNHCTPTSWTTQSSGVTSYLRGVWGASGSDIFAVGDDATIIRGNGTTWKTMAVPQNTNHLMGVDGTSSTNVFAIESSLASASAGVYRFDGTSWTKRTTVGCYDFCCVGAIGPDDAYLWNSGGQLIRVTNGVAKLVTSISTPDTLDHDCMLRVRSASDVYISGGFTYHYDGTSITELKASGGTSQGSEGLVAFGPTQVITFVSSTVGRWNGTQWTSIPTGLGVVLGIGGIAINRVFAVGYSSSGATGTASFWDGSGWSGETLPAGTLPLYGVWAASTGEVYAVGAKGTIVKTVR